MKRRAAYLVSLTVLTAALGHAQNAFPFLRNDVSPRIAALGGAFASMPEDPNSIFVNPGALTTVPERRFALSYMDHLLDINAGSFAVTLPETPIGRLTVGVLYIHYGSFEQTDQAANQYGTFTAADMAFSGGTAYDVVDRVSVGGAVKFIHSALGDYRSEAAAADVGAFYAIPEERLSFGISLMHIGAQLSTYAGRTETLPMDLRIGVTKRPEHLPVLLNLNFQGLNDPDRSISERLKQFSFGAEFDMSTSLRLRIGYNNRIRRDMQLGTSAGLAGFSAGTGIDIAGYRIDYAYNSYGAVGGLHRLGLSASF